MQRNTVTSSLSMEQSLAKDVADRSLSSIPIDCHSCKCLRRRERTFSIGCSRASRGLESRGAPRTHEVFWRPWTHNSCRKESRKTVPYATSLCENPQSGQKTAEYNHPVRLFWPKSKSLNDMYLEAADLLRSFPVQATLSFYNDSESDTDEENNSEEEHDSGFESE